MSKTLLKNDMCTSWSKLSQKLKNDIKILLDQNMQNIALKVQGPIFQNWVFCFICEDVNLKFRLKRSHHLDVQS